MLTRTLSIAVHALARCLVVGAVGGAVISAASSSATAEELFRRGDVNGDQAFDISDAVFSFSFLFLGGEKPACLDAADSNDDGSVDLSDGIFILNHLFLSGDRPPPPDPTSACPGRDPTDDPLTCDGGFSPDLSPTAQLFVVDAFAPAVRQRSRDGLDGQPVVLSEGNAFVLVLEARSNPDSAAGFSLFVDDDDPRGDASRFQVICDRDLGDPDKGGIASGSNLAGLFSRDIDPWVEPIYLLEQHSLRFPGDAAWSPSPGTYVFTATVSDDRCALSEFSSLEVTIGDARPEFFISIEHADGGLAQHEADSGQVRIEDGLSYRLVIELSRASSYGENLPALRVVRRVAGEETVLDQDLASAALGRWELELTGEHEPGEANTDFEVSFTSEGDETRTKRLTIQRPVSYAAHVQPIWNVHCTGCHEKPNPFKGLEVVGDVAEQLRRNIANVFAAEPAIDSIAPLLVRPYSPERSYLFHKLRGSQLDPAVAGEGDRMPQGGGFLSAREMWIVRSWILQGAD